MSEALKHLTQVNIMFLDSLAVDKDVIKINYHEFSKHVAEGIMHQPLKGSWCVPQPGWKYYILIESIGCEKSSSLDMWFVYLYLMVGVGEIDTGKYSSIT